VFIVYKVLLLNKFPRAKALYAGNMASNSPLNTCNAKLPIPALCQVQQSTIHYAKSFRSSSMLRNGWGAMFKNYYRIYRLHAGCRPAINFFFSLVSVFVNIFLCDSVLSRYDTPFSALAFGLPLLAYLVYLQLFCVWQAP
jgi:hypothetical protein